MKFNQIIFPMLIVLALQLNQSTTDAQLLCEFFPHLCATESPSVSPSTTTNPSSNPSPQPSSSPTKSSSPSVLPTTSPSFIPSDVPSSNPSDIPSIHPSIHPSDVPSHIPSITPSSTHSSIPSTHPSNPPSSSPTTTQLPTTNPTITPSSSSIPSSVPTNTPSTSTKPSTHPTISPSTSITPSIQPSLYPSTYPSITPTSYHSINPSITPSITPTKSHKPSIYPTVHPSVHPSSYPSELPTNVPTTYPSTYPSELPTTYPSEGPTSSPTFGPRPNLIMVLTDEHNLRTLGCYRSIFQSKSSQDQKDQAFIWGDNIAVETPHLDKLASQGALFTNFHTVAPLCTPSRASFMSGLYPQKTGAGKNHGRMNDDIVTFAEILEKERGYYTGYGGKWHLNGNAKPGWSEHTIQSNGETTTTSNNNNDPDYRRFGFKDSTYLWNRGHWKFVSNDGQNNREVYEFWERNKFRGTEDKNFTTDYLFDRSIDFMKDAIARDEPFAYVLSIPDPHAPNEVRQPYEDMYKHMHFELPKTAKMAVRRNPATPSWNYNEHGDVQVEDAEQYLRQYENHRHYQNHLQQYFGMVKCIDDNVGKLLDFIDNEGLFNNTIVIFTSDHGDMLGEHGKMNKGRPFRTSAGVPFILRYPGQVQEGKIIQSVLTSVDFAPTILKVMGVENGGGTNFDGTDFSNELLSRYPTTNYPRTRFSFDTNDNPQWAAVFRRQLRLVISKVDVPWLFDLSADPYEVENFFDVPRYEAQRDSLLEALKEAFDEHDIPLKNSPFIYWSTPSCADSADRIKIDSINYTCEDIGDRLSMDLCTTNQDLRDHCEVTCNSCCEDSTGEMLVRGQSMVCSELRNKCGNYKVMKFCPATCGTCSSSNNDHNIFL